MGVSAEMVAVTTKLKPEEKSAFASVCESIGTTPSNAIRMFVSAFNRRGGFPFDPSNPYGFSSETLRAMDDAAEGRDLYGPYQSAAEAISAAISEE